MMVGPNFDAIREFARGVSVPVIASGGVTTLDDLRTIREMEKEGVSGRSSAALCTTARSTWPRR